MCHDLGHERTEATFPSTFAWLMTAWKSKWSGARSRELAEVRFVTIGNFDGVHAGHAYLLRAKWGPGARAGTAALVLTFDPHPACVVAPERAPDLLTSLEERVAADSRPGNRAGLCSAVYSPKSPDCRRKNSWRGIVRDELQARMVMVGDNFRFGNKQAGDPAVLDELGRRYGFETRIVEAVKLRGLMVSTSEIRRRIDEGKCRWRGAAAGASVCASKAKLSRATGSVRGRPCRR